MSRRSRSAAAPASPPPTPPATAPTSAGTAPASPARSLATLLVLADGRLPAGGHAHSGGLESAVAAGRLRDLDGLAAFLAGRLATTGRVAAAFAASACAAVSQVKAGTANASIANASIANAYTGNDATGRDADPPVGGPDGPLPGLAELDAGLDARTPSPALRRASRAQGRALLRAGRAMWPVGPGPAQPHHPVALGMVAAAAGLGPFDAAVAAGYGTVSGPASAAVRLLGLDPYAVHALLADLAGECDRLAAEAAACVGDPVDELPADSAPLLEIGAEIHASREVRLFAS